MNKHYLTTWQGLKIAKNKLFSGEEILEKISTIYHKLSNELKEARLKEDDLRITNRMSEMWALSLLADELLDVVDSEKFLDLYVAEKDDKGEENDYSRN